MLVEPQNAGDEQQFAVARAAEEAGYDAFFRSDHLLPLAEGAAGPGPTDAWLTLAALAVRTERLRLGVMGSTATFRFPGPLAIAAAQLDRMSGGRAELGLSTGWFEAEHAAWGVPFPDEEERFDRFAEQLAVLTGLWRTGPGERFTFHGRHYRLIDAPELPAFPGGTPTLIVSGGGPADARKPELAARYADEFNLPALPLAEARAQHELARAECRRWERERADLVWSMTWTVCCGESEARVRGRAERIPGGMDRLRSTGLVGSPERCVDELARYAAIGVRRAYLRMWDLNDLDQLDLVAEKVLPHLR